MTDRLAALPLDTRDPSARRVDGTTIYRLERKGENNLKENEKSRLWGSSCRTRGLPGLSGEA